MRIFALLVCILAVAVGALFSITAGMLVSMAERSTLSPGDIWLVLGFIVLCIAWVGGPAYGAYRLWKKRRFLVTALVMLPWCVLTALAIGGLVAGISAAAQ